MLGPVSAIVIVWRGQSGCSRGNADAKLGIEEEVVEAEAEEEVLNQPCDLIFHLFFRRGRCQ